MKRFILFAGWTYYPSGGLNDVQGMYDTLDEVRDALDGQFSHPSPGNWDWFNVLDTQTGAQLFNSLNYTTTTLPLR